MKKSKKNEDCKTWAVAGFIFRIAKYKNNQKFQGR